MRRLPASILALILAAAMPAAAQPQPVAADTAVLAESGIVFPEKLGNFTRVSITSVEAGRVGAYYALPAGGPVSANVDIFVRRVGEPLAEEFANTEAIIGDIYSDLAALRDLPAPPAAPGAVGRLWKGKLDGRPVLTGMMLSHRDGWRIKIRGTVSADQGEAGWAEVERLMREFDWGRPRS